MNNELFVVKKLVNLLISERINVLQQSKVIVNRVTHLTKDAS